MAELKVALHAELGIEALARVDLSSGRLLDSSARDEASREALELAALTVCDLALAPSLEAWRDGETGSDVREAIVVSERAVHVMARSRSQPGHAVVGVARAGANVALVLAAARSLAESGDGSNAREETH